jgi:hypothetical protein
VIQVETIPRPDYAKTDLRVRFTYTHQGKRFELLDENGNPEHLLLRTEDLIHGDPKVNEVDVKATCERVMKVLKFMGFE